MKTKEKIEFGDFQTPDALAEEACALVSRLLSAQPDHILEPTVGKGAFLLAAAKQFPSATLHGRDINREYVEESRVKLAAVGAAGRSHLSAEDFFSCDWEAVVRDLPGSLAIIGNPPWVTNAGVSSVDGSNLPVKQNFQGLRGIAARTGKANFDISEWMLIRLLQALEGRESTWAILCKTATARKFLKHAWSTKAKVAEAALYAIDASYHFDATVSACLLFVRTGSRGTMEADVYSGLASPAPSSRFGLAGKDLVSDITTYRELQHLEGLCPFQWRSGVKHDCASIMELRPIVSGVYENGLGERVSVEPDYVYPLLKCSDLANNRTDPQKAVIVTQRKVGEDTSVIEDRAPATWRYLQLHADRFAARKSSIYKAGMQFAMFGVGEYSFTPWKVAISGLHRSLLFQVVGHVDEQPVFFDDTCYYLSFQSEDQARLVAAILNSPLSRRYLSCLAFADAKHPVTVDLLQRINLALLAEESGFGNEWQKLQRSPLEFAAAEAAQLTLLMETGHNYRARKARG